MTRGLVLALSFGCGFACGGGSGAPAESDSIALKAFEFSEYCLETGVTRCERCRADQDVEREACLRVCAALAARTGSSSCFAACGVPADACDAECGLEPNACASPGFRFEPSLPRDSAVASACARANSRNRACRQSPLRTDCESSARLEREEAAEVYRCLAELECGASPNVCVSRLGESMFGASLAESCASQPLEAALISAVNRAAVWVRPEVLSDALICAEQACSTQRFSACVQAWVGAL